MSKWETDNWEVSENNWMEAVREGMKPPDSFELHEITMRDGAHVVDFSGKERIQLSEALSDLGVLRILPMSWNTSMTNLASSMLICVTIP